MDAAALEEITTGHTWTGWDLARNNSFIQEFGPGGTVVYASATTLMSGSTHVQDDMLCMQSALINMGRVGCGYVYRNREGTPAESDEFTYVVPGWILRFSVKR